MENDFIKAPFDSKLLNLQVPFQNSLRLLGTEHFQQNSSGSQPSANSTRSGNGEPLNASLGDGGIAGGSNSFSFSPWAAKVERKMRSG